MNELIKRNFIMKSGNNLVCILILLWLWRVVFYLCCDTVWSGRQIQTFWRSILPERRSTAVFLWNIGMHLS